MAPWGERRQMVLSGAKVGGSAGSAPPVEFTPSWPVHSPVRQPQVGGTDWRAEPALLFAGQQALGQRPRFCSLSRSEQIEDPAVEDAVEPVAFRLVILVGGHDAGP